MSIDFIELLDSHIMATEDVVIEEERIKDDYNIYFNDAQIKSHLTNLLYDGKKVAIFFDFKSHTFMVESWLLEQSNLESAEKQT